MGIREALFGRNGEANLHEDLQIARWNQQLLQESLAELEMQITGDEVGWRRIAMQLQRDFTRDGLDRMMDLSRAMYLSNPLIQRAVNVRAYYVWAQGVTYDAQDDQVQEEIVDPLIDDEYNKAELFGHQAAILSEIDQTLDGNMFLPLFTDDAGDVQVRSIPSEQIRDIISDPEDERKTWFYHRVWQRRELDRSTGRISTYEDEAFYPDLSYVPRTQQAQIGNIEVMWDAPVIHTRTGGLKHMVMGVPEAYAATDWARAYQKFLEDWHTIVASLAMFAWRTTAKGSKSDALKSKVGGRVDDELEEPPRMRKPPIPGSIVSGVSPDDFTPINKSGAHTSAEDAKPSRMMVGSAMDLPDTILSGDPQQGNLATAKTLDRPTELAMRSRQAFWQEHRARIFRYVIENKVRRGRLPGAVRRYADYVRVEPRVDPTVNVVFPPILEHDVTETVSALVTAATLDGKADAGTIPRDELSKQLMSAVGIEDVSAAMDELDQADAEQIAAAVERITEALAEQQRGD